MRVLTILTITKQLHTYYLKRGKLVGWPTFGGVISTGGRTLMDGSRVRLPLRGWYVYPSGINMENNGAEPDIPVFISPGHEDKNLDPQLDAAIIALLKDIE